MTGKRDLSFLGERVISAGTFYHLVEEGYDGKRLTASEVVGDMVMQAQAFLPWELCADAEFDLVAVTFHDLDIAAHDGYRDVSQRRT